MRIKSIIFILTFVIFNSITLAQQKIVNYNKPANSIGIEIGPSLSQFIHERFLLSSEKMYNFKMGYSAGIFYEHYLNSIISYKASICFSRKIIYEDFWNINFVTNEMAVQPWQYFYNYISFPLHVKMNFKKSRFFFDAGTSIDTYLCDKIKWFDFITNNYVAQIGNKKDFRRFVFYLNVGIGANIPVRKKYDLSFEIRDNFGLTRVGKDAPLINNQKSRLSFNSIFFLYGFTYHFPVKRK